MIFWPRNEQDEQRIIRWVAGRLGIEFGNARALAFMGEDKSMQGGIVYSQWIEPYRSLEASIAVKPGHKFSRSELRLIFWYPFQGIGCQRLQVTCARKNKRSQRFVRRLGFVYEGKGRRAFGDDDACVYSMLDHEWRASPWFMEINDGQIERRRGQRSAG